MLYAHLKTKHVRRLKMNISARNMLKGKVKSVKPGVVNTEITVELSGGDIVTSIITKESAEKLALAAGKDVYAVIKASNVMIAVD
jgi:molybdopterin-binding protein